MDDKLLHAFSAHLHNGNVLYIELMALYMGLKLCKRLNIYRIWVKVDALNVVNFINKKCYNNMNIYYLVLKIMNVMKVLDMNITHIFRVGNYYAYLLAKRGCVCSSLKVFLLS